MHNGLLAVVAVLGLGFADAAVADSMEVNVRANAGSVEDAARDTASNVPDDPQAFASVLAANGSTLASAAGRAEAGSLGVFVQASSNGVDFTQANAQSVFRDSLLVSAPLLPFGTPVMLTFDLLPPLPGAVGTCVSCGGGVTATLDLTFGSAIRDGAVEWQQGVTGIATYTGSFMTMLATVGSRVQIEGSLIGRLLYGRPFGAGGMQLDLLNTVHFFVDSLTDGVTLIADSGHDYSRSVVPEPASALLLTWGLVLLVVVKRLGPPMRAAGRLDAETA